MHTQRCWPLGEQLGSGREAQPLPLAEERELEVKMRADVGVGRGGKLLYSQLGSLRQEDRHTLTASLSYVVRPCLKKKKTRAGVAQQGKRGDISITPSSEVACGRQNEGVA